MCYISNVRQGICRFDLTVLERKIRHKCVFCGYTRSKRYWFFRQCPALNQAGTVIVEPTPVIQWWDAGSNRSVGLSAGPTGGLRVARIVITGRE